MRKNRSRKTTCLHKSKLRSYFVREWKCLCDSGKTEHSFWSVGRCRWIFQNLGQRTEMYQLLKLPREGHKNKIQEITTGTYFQTINMLIFFPCSQRSRNLYICSIAGTYFDWFHWLFEKKGRRRKRAAVCTRSYL